MFTLKLVQIFILNWVIVLVLLLRVPLSSGHCNVLGKYKQYLGKYLYCFSQCEQRETNFRPISRQQPASRNYFLTPCEIDHRNVSIVNPHMQANHTLIFISSSHLCFFFILELFNFFLCLIWTLQPS